MHHRFLSWLLAGLVLTSMVMRAQTPAPAAAKVTGGAELILVAKATGTVTMTLNGATTTLKQNDKVARAAKINTLKESSVVLVFSNGATAQLGQETEMVIEEYLQDPFASAVKVADLTEEPSVSTTKLKLNRGELVGKVAHLKHDKGSSFVIETPVGAAGIRGTTFRIIFRPNGTGQAFFQLSTVEGNVAFAQPGTGGTPGNNTGSTPAPGVTGQGTADVAVPQGQQISIDVSVTVNAQGQTVVAIVTPVSSTVNIPPAVAAAVTQTATEIAVATQQAVFTPSPTPTPTTGGGTGGTNSGTGSSGTTGDSSGGTSGSTGGTSGSTSGNTTQINGSNFTGTVTQPIPPLTPGAGKG